MKIILFYHSLVSDWNHGNAHFLRGIVSEMLERGFEVKVYEPENGWSRQNLLKEHGTAAIAEFYTAYPHLHHVAEYYDLDTLDLDEALEGAQIVIVHEWNEPELVRRIGQHHAQNPAYRLFFHDTHHRSVTKPEQISQYDLTHYDAVLAFGEMIRQQYLKHKRPETVWTWHEAADTRMFSPRPEVKKIGDLVWIGNWGDGERSEELMEFLIQPVKELGLKAAIYGVRYSEKARQDLADAGIQYHGWVPNYRVPELFARYRVTVHVPRRPYARDLPGIPTIRPFEAMTCGIPLVCAPWQDAENLFTPGKDYLVAQNGTEMKQHLYHILTTPELANSLAEHGQQTIKAKHSCAHRVDRLLSVFMALENRMAFNPLLYTNGAVS